jgi:hypothetical protein
MDRYEKRETTQRLQGCHAAYQCGCNPANHRSVYQPGPDILRRLNKRDLRSEIEHCRLK